MVPLVDSTFAREPLSELSCSSVVPAGAGYRIVFVVLPVSAAVGCATWDEPGSTTTITSPVRLESVAWTVWEIPAPAHTMVSFPDTYLSRRTGR